MQEHTIITEQDNKVLTRVNKTKARNLYNKGTKIYLFPCKARYPNMWINLFDISQEENDEFNLRVTYYEVYNCVGELGSYANFFVEIES